MNTLIKKDKEQIALRSKKLREMLSLTQEQLAMAIGVSRGTYVAVEKAKGFTGDTLLAICHFFGMTLTEFSNFNIALPSELELREKIKRYHVNNNSTKYKVLENPPLLSSIIEFRLLRSDFLKEPRRVSEIIDYINDEYKLLFNSSVLSQALKEEVNRKHLKRTKGTGNGFLYVLAKRIKP